mgnify:CR=1 FL=1
MKTLSNLQNVFATKVNAQTIRVIVTLISLVLFALAAGAPDIIGGVGMG